MESIQKPRPYISRALFISPNSDFPSQLGSVFGIQSKNILTIPESEISIHLDALLSEANRLTTSSHPTFYLIVYTG